MGFKKVFPVKQAHSHQFTDTLVDDEGVAITLANISTMTLTLWNGDETPGAAAIINLRTAQDVKNANNATMHATSGLFTWDMQPLDNPLRDATAEEELHPFYLAVTHTQAGGFFYATYAARVQRRGLPT